MRIVFDAEPLLAYALDGEGARDVRRVFERMERGRDEGLASRVNLAEVGYVLAHRGLDPGEVVADLTGLGLRPVPCEPAWEGAAAAKARHGLGLADAFALATARAVQGTLATSDRPLAAACAREGVRVLRM